MGPGPAHRCLAPLVVLLLICRYAAADGIWCVASPRASDALLQEGLNYACGQVDCSPIQSGGSCFVPDTVRDHASYAFNAFFQMDPRKKSCDFSGGAMLTTTDPSTATCKYPSKLH
ncbi:unnamed protein product [Alopecurus aequalis]